MRRRPTTVLLGALVGTALLVAGCGVGGDVEDYVEDTYERVSRTGDSAVYRSPDPVGTTAAAIAAAVPPAARQADGAAEYLRYDDDVVVVSGAPTGATVLVEDLDGRYRSGFYAFLGPGFRPGSPAAGSGSGGPGDGK